MRICVRTSDISSELVNFFLFLHYSSNHSARWWTLSTLTTAIATGTIYHMKVNRQSTPRHWTKFNNKTFCVFLIMSVKTYPDCVKRKILKLLKTFKIMTIFRSLKHRVNNKLCKRYVCMFLRTKQCVVCGNPSYNQHTRESPWMNISSCVQCAVAPPPPRPSLAPRSADLPVLHITQCVSAAQLTQVSRHTS